MIDQESFRHSRRSWEKLISQDEIFWAFAHEQRRDKQRYKLNKHSEGQQFKHNATILRHIRQQSRFNWSHFCRVKITMKLFSSPIFVYGNFFLRRGRQLMKTNFPGKRWKGEFSLWLENDFRGSEQWFSPTSPLCIGIRGRENENTWEISVIIDNFRMVIYNVVSK